MIIFSETKLCIQGYILDPGSFPWNGDAIESLSVGCLITGMIKVNLTVYLHGYNTEDSISHDYHVISSSHRVMVEISVPATASHLPVYRYTHNKCEQ